MHIPKQEGYRKRNWFKRIRPLLLVFVLKKLLKLKGGSILGQREHLGQNNAILISHLSMYANIKVIEAQQQIT